MNMEKIEISVKKAERLLEFCEKLPDNDILSNLGTNLSDSIEYCHDEHLGKPLVISLIGGTGTGKSYIFSRLYGQEAASPSSDAIRGFTKELFIAAGDSDKPFLNFGEQVNYLPGILEGAVLVDTPDLDSIHAENAALTQKLISDSDLLVYVTTPDKRSNFDINQTIIKWAERKRWLFVMNKTDTAGDVAPRQLKKDFFTKIESMGFPAEESSIFLFSARDNDSFEFKRLKDVIFSRRSFRQNTLIRELACMRSLLHALTREQACEKILHLHNKLSEQRDKIEARLQELQQQVLNEHELDELADRVRTTEAMRHLSQKRSLFLFPYIVAANHLHSDVSPTDLAYAFSRNLRENQEFVNCFQDEERTLKDLKLSGNEAESTLTNEEKAFSALEIKTSLVESANRVAASKTISFYLMLGNLLPGIILIQALYRTFASWLTGVWLPSDFFLHAIMLIAGSTLPGYLLFAKGVSRLSASYDMSNYQLKLAAKKLVKAQKDLQNCLIGSQDLEAHLIKQIEKDEQQLAPGYAGVTMKNPRKKEL
jgi:hypothetical protein